MTESSLQKVLAALERVSGHKPPRSASGWEASCPAHDDTNPSLSIAEGRDGRVLLYCHRGCAVEHVVNRLGLSMRDLF